MRTTREELHRLVDAVDDDTGSDAAEVLRGLSGRVEQPERRLSFVASLAGGPENLAERHEDHLQEQSDPLA